MARRARKDETPYNPIQAALIQRIAGPAVAAGGGTQPAPAPPAAETAIEPPAPLEAPPYHEEASPAPRRTAPVAGPIPSEDPAQSGAAALRPPPEVTRHLVRTASASPPRRATREKRVLLSWDDERAIDQLSAELSGHCQTPVQFSNILRACVILLRHAQEAVAGQVRSQGLNMDRPAYNDPAAMAVFEHRLAQLIHAGLKDAARLR